jgi:hypothetical protein
MYFVRVLLDFYHNFIGNCYKILNNMTYINSPRDMPRIQQSVKISLFAIFLFSLLLFSLTQISLAQDDLFSGGVTNTFGGNLAIGLGSSSLLIGAGTLVVKGVSRAMDKGMQKKSKEVLNREIEAYEQVDGFLKALDSINNKATYKDVVNAISEEKNVPRIHLKEKTRTSYDDLMSTLREMIPSPNNVEQALSSVNLTLITQKRTMLKETLYKDFEKLKLVPTYS